MMAMQNFVLYIFMDVKKDKEGCIAQTLKDEIPVLELWGVWSQPVT